MENLKPTRRARPSNSVAIGGTIGAPIAVILPALLAHWGIAISAEVAGAVGALITSIVAYFPRGGRAD